jgi:hypothetical protein
MNAPKRRVRKRLSVFLRFHIENANASARALLPVSVCSSHCRRVIGSERAMAGKASWRFVNVKRETANGRLINANEERSTGFSKESCSWGAPGRSNPL